MKRVKEREKEERERRRNLLPSGRNKRPEERFCRCASVVIFLFLEEAISSRWYKKKLAPLPARVFFVPSLVIDVFYVSSIRLTHRLTLHGVGHTIMP